MSEDTNKGPENAGSTAARILRESLNGLLMHQLKLSKLVRDTLSEPNPYPDFQVARIERLDEITGELIDKIWRAYDLENREANPLKESLELHRSQLTTLKD